METSKVYTTEIIESGLLTVAQKPGGRRQVISFAARGALRTLPFLSDIDVFTRPDRALTEILICFFSSQVSWAVGRLSEVETSNSEIKKAAKSAASLSAAYSHKACRFASNAAFAASTTSLRTLCSTAAQIPDAFFVSDYEIVMRGGQISDKPLLVFEEPIMTNHEWPVLKDRLLAMNQGWEVWTEWYDARLRGGLTHPKLTRKANERVEIARFLEITDSDLDFGPAHVNGKIKAIIERETQRDLKRTYAKQVLSDEEEKIDAGFEGNDVPPNNPASVRATWDAGRQKAFLDTSAIDADVGTGVAVAELQALREAIDQLCKRLAEMSKTNIDRDGATLLKATHDAIPNGIPTSVELSAIIIREIVHERYHSTVVEQWPETLRAEYEGVSISLTAALDLFPERRQRRRIDWSAKLEDLPAQHVKGALQSANEVLKSESGQMVVDTAITAVIDDQAAALPTEGNLADPADRATAMDGLESLHNTAKTLARNAPDKVEVQNVLDGLDTVISQEADAFEEGARKGVRKALGMAGEAAGIARVSERAGRSVWDRLPGLDWLRRRGKKLDPRVKPEDDA